jgi:hypothetical protein
VPKSSIAIRTSLRRVVERHADARDLQAAEPGEGLAVPDHRARLGLQGLGRAVDAQLQRAGDVLTCAERRQILGELLRGPPVRRGRAVEGVHGGGAGLVGRAQHGLGVAGHEPGDGALRHLGDAAEAAVGEVGPAHEAHMIVAAAAVQPERVGEGESG